MLSRLRERVHQLTRCEPAETAGKVSLFDMAPLLKYNEGKYIVQGFIGRPASLTVETIKKLADASRRGRIKYRSRSLDLISHISQKIFTQPPSSTLWYCLPSGEYISNTSTCPCHQNDGTYAAVQICTLRPECTFAYFCLTDHYNHWF
jgi:hypothetical protein